MNLFEEAVNAFNSSKDNIKEHIENKLSIPWMAVTAYASDLEPVSLIKKEDGEIGLAFKFKETCSEGHFSVDHHGNEGNEFVTMERFYPVHESYGVYDQQGNVHLTGNYVVETLDDLCLHFQAEKV